ncbi:hypothetical protein DPMN_035624 [Dreissena polymorpha]|uniref:Uncharacterized protein n=1 Tax=Dreissena polymorpha TaxID=45954 RepID=A0A9D4M960_DREPO|nr:hypothetical protein DPMN_035624 [Dreissena polymorpha]
MPSVCHGEYLLCLSILAVHDKADMPEGSLGVVGRPVQHGVVHALGCYVLGVVEVSSAEGWYGN